MTSDWRACWLVLKERILYYSYWKGEGEIKSFEMDLRKARQVGKLANNLTPDTPFCIPSVW